jgi:hypothetical protein
MIPFHHSAVLLVAFAGKVEVYPQKQLPNYLSLSERSPAIFTKSRAFSQDWKMGSPHCSSIAISAPTAVQLLFFC